MPRKRGRQKKKRKESKESKDAKCGSTDESGDDTDKETERPVRKSRALVSKKDQPLARRDRNEAKHQRSDGSDCTDDEPEDEPVKKERGLLLKNEYPEVFAQIKHELYSKSDLAKITAHSHDKLMFHCEKCGLDWPARVDDRTRANNKATGCSNCSRPKLLKDEYPEIHAQLKPDLNPTINVDEVASHSRDKLMFHCEKCGLDWPARVGDRTRANNKATGCSNCSRPKLLKDEYPEIHAELKPDLNPTINVDEIAAHSNRRVNWKCGKHIPIVASCKGHIWPAAVCDRTGGSETGCRFCAGRQICDCYPEKKMGSRKDLMAEFDRKKNHRVRNPENLPIGSNTKYWWICQAHKSCKMHSWPAPLRARALDGNGCPWTGCCPNPRQRCNCVTERMLSGHPDLVAEIDVKKNKKHKIDINQTIQSHQIIHWKCKSCKYRWPTMVKNRANGTGCPECSRNARESKPERAVKEVLKAMGIISRKRRFADCRDKLPLEWDFFLEGIGNCETLIETDGNQHFRPYSKSEIDNIQFIGGQKRDVIKNNYALAKKFNFLRISESAQHLIPAELRRFIEDVKSRTATSKPLFRCVGKEYNTAEYKGYGADIVIPERRSRWSKKQASTSALPEQTSSRNEKSPRSRHPHQPSPANILQKRKSPHRQ